MKKSIIISSILIVSSIITLNSCKKKVEVDNESQSVVDNAICEQQFMAIQPVVNDKGIQESGIKRTSANETWTILGAINTASVTTPGPIGTADVNGDGKYDNGPVTFQLTYLSNHIGNDGIGRTGSLNITTLRRWSATNNPVTVDLIGFKVNGITYSGTVKITKSNSTTVSVEVINGHCTDGSWNIDYAGTKTLTQTGGQNTPNIEADDVYEISGNSTGLNREGRSFTTNITNALVKKSSCKYITSGSLDLTPDGFKTRTVDFGNGTCDDDATYTVNGQTISFKLK